jgi:PmbA protein
LPNLLAWAFVFSKTGIPVTLTRKRLTEEALSQTLRDALSHCEFSKELSIDLPEPQHLRQLKSAYNPDLDSIGIPEMVAFALEIEREAFAASPEINNIPYLGVERNESAMVVANSKGVFYKEKNNAISAGIGAVATRHDVKKLGVYNKGGLYWNTFNAQTIAQKAVEYARELLGASPIEGGRIPVVFSERVAGSIVSMYSSSFFAEQVQKGQSRLQGCLGKNVASACFSLTNDPFRDDLPGASAFDGEGVVTQQIPLVQQGEHKDYLYNLETAANENKKSNGAASRRYSGKVVHPFRI